MEPAAQRAASTVQVGLDGGDREAEEVGDLGVGVALDVAQDDGDAVVLGQLGERGADLVDERETFGVDAKRIVGKGEVVDRSEVVERDGGVVSAPSSHERCVGGDAVEPGEYCGLGSELTAVAPGLDECVLNGFVDVSIVVEQARDDAADAMLIALHERQKVIELARRILDILLAGRIVQGVACIEEDMQLLGMVRHGTCVGTRRRFNDLCDGDLDAGTEGRVRRHLAGCGRCRRALGRLRATIADLAMLADRRVPEGESVLDRVAERIAELDSAEGAR